MSAETISHYDILSELGRGGMGVVYKAADTKLDRTVALKVLPPHSIGSQDDRARFYREARAAAALHHPHIATIFEIDEDDGQPFIAMEYVDGQALDDRIAERPLPLKQAVGMAIQIAEALKAAHAKNIVHRDIKSANVMLTSSGDAKVLDFGLAKTAASTKLTQMGSTLGTVAYMSPQQARGEDVDHRTDLWSLGAVMYQMIAGKLPFPGDFEQAVVYSILNEEPQPLTAVRTGVPMGLEWIVSKLLAKDPDERYQTATDLLVDLRTVDLTAAGMSRSRVAAADPAALQSAESKSTRKRSVASVWVMAGFLVGLAVMGLIWAFVPKSMVTETVVETSVKRFQVPLRASRGLSGVDISPDGSKIVYADVDNTVDNVHVLDLATGVTRTIEGSAGTVLVSVSPDGQWVLLTKSVSIERVSMFAGTPLPVVTTEEGTPRADWGPGNWVVYENQQAIWKASTETNEAMPFTVKDTTSGEVDHDWPRLLPDGRTVMATIEYGSKPSVVGLWDFDTGERKGQIPLPGYRARYVSSGHLMLVLGAASGNLVALPFDLGTLSPTGPPVPVLANVSTLIATSSDGGTLVTGGEQGTELRSARATPLAVVTFPSGVRLLNFEPAIYGSFEISPDGKKVAAEIMTVDTAYLGEGSVARNMDVWVLDLEHGTKIQLSSGGLGRGPTWSADGDSVIYILDMKATSVGGLVIQAADGSGSARSLGFNVGAQIIDVDVSPDGSHAAYVLGESGTGVTRLIVRDLRSGGTVDLSGRLDANIRRPRFSPDGRYVTYQTGARALVRSADGSDVPVEIGQAGIPRWSSDGTALYTSNGGVVFKRDISLAPRFSHRPPSRPVAYGLGAFTYYDVFKDGRAGLFNLSDRGSGSAGSAPADTTISVTVTVNWFETLKRNRQP
ncbi:MAG: WD40 repeat domain-containing serine/threonine protein kinase [Rhodothermales bacterium]